MAKIDLKRHNWKPARKLVNNFDDGIKHQVYVSGVGTGKTFVAMYVMQHIQGKILYVMPKHVIKENIEGYEDFAQFGNRVEFATYNASATKEKALGLMKDKSLVIIDECHHLGSDLYGKNLLHAMDETNVPVLGLTATPIRGKGSRKVDTRTYFDVCIDGISNFDAIRLGLMPVIDYRICDPEFTKHEVDYISEGKERMVLSYDNAKDIIGDTIKKFPKDKWICYFSTSKDLREYKEMVKSLFPEYHCVTLLSSLKNLSEVVDIVRSEEKVVILSCNILLEGVHLDGIDGIILFRNVSTVGTLQQIIGRVCSIGKKESPVILDCAASARKLLPELMEENGKVGSGNTTKNSVSNKEVVRIGLGAEKKFDIKEFLKAKRFLTEEEKEEKIRSVWIKYKELGGKSTREQILSDKKSNDYKILKACCWMFEITPYMALNSLTADALSKEVI